MKKLLTRIGISLLFAASVGSTFAQRGPDRDGRDSRRGESQQRMPDRNSYQPEGNRYQPEGNRYQGREQAEGGQRHGRMSPEERQALRRQINEAGRDIYSRPRR